MESKVSDAAEREVSKSENLKHSFTREEFEQIVQYFTRLAKWRDEAIRNGTWTGSISKKETGYQMMQQPSSNLRLNANSKTIL